MSVNPLTELPDCPICGGFRWVHPVKDGRVLYNVTIRCSCVAASDVEERQSHFLKHCQLPSYSDNLTFESFDPGSNKDLAEAYQYAQELAEEQGQVKWLTLIGRVDRGKTHLAVAICRRWLERKKPARYCLVPLALQELRNGFERDGEESYRAKLDLLCHVPLLVLDDLGEERVTDWTREQLQQIIHYRGINGLPLVVTTNAPLDNLPGDDMHRIGSRLQRESFCRVVVIRATEHRLSKGK